MNWLAEIHLRQAGRCLMVLMPVLLLWVISGDALWLRAAVMAVATLIGVERAHLAPAGVLLQALAVTMGFLLLFFALQQPVLFVLGCGLMAAAAIGLSAFGRKLRSLGNFVFIPALYLACETAEGLVPAQFAAHAWHFLPYMLISMLPVLLLSLIEHHRRGRQQAAGMWRHYLCWRHQRDAGEAMPVAAAMLAVGLAVACAAALVEWQQLGHGQWVVWSAASVVTGDVLSSRRKLRDRGLGALIGVPLGIGIGSLLPHTPVMYALVALASVTTLVSFHRYIVGFAARCTCVACALILLNESAMVASERLVNVLLGGVIGLGFVLLVDRLLPAPRIRAA
ncbi:FUSC family protein [Paludibacterium sp. THUN1379]|uniref:FUSC family protein n=1 Tax=Paludibacterium sp. THUN1379 TaxID=3112107 RepID=UPI0030913C4B|nr:FUSC family protein [Paludibacterium sp. THUN1379]